jgi:acyl dehydratase
MSTAYDAIEVGRRYEFGTFAFTAERIKAFARKWDPQLFHMDEESAIASAFGALCASGWHTASVAMRLQVDYFAAARARGEAVPRFGPSPGFEDLKWSRPVYAGDVIAYSGTIVAKRLSRSRPGWAIVTSQWGGANQNGEAVFSLTSQVFVVV